MKRRGSRRREILISRHVLFYIATLLAVGGYLLVTSVAAAVIGGTGGQWSVWLAVLFLGAALALLAGALFSTRLRAHCRALLIKHFFRSKYDYRREWLRLTQSLGRSGELSVLAYRGLEALAQIVGSTRGDLWLARSPGRYEWAASLGEAKATLPSYTDRDPLVAFLAERSWVVDSEEYGVAPDRYDAAFGDTRAQQLPQNAIIVPLDCQGYLQGFVSLERPPAAGRLNFEDHDILKTAGKQVAVVLAQSLAVEQLAETRQFEAMSKMSTFLMHDLKNIVAQQQLVVSNASRFRQRPEFFDDAIATVRSGVERMLYLLAQLKSGAASSAAGRADLSKVLMEVRSSCADRQPVPTIDAGNGALWVRMERAKLLSALTHLVRNAQDATPPDGEIRLQAVASSGAIVCSVADTGCGMDAAFLRERLFRPFDSTKGEHGMGIGAYQVREMVRAAGGDVEVSSAPNEGSVFRLRLPLAENAAGTQTALSGR
jgi:putative PEP-CTERM system histidine kinase